MSMHTNLNVIRLCHYFTLNEGPLVIQKYKNTKLIQNYFNSNE